VVEPSQCHNMDHDFFLLGCIKKAYNMDVVDGNDLINHILVAAADIRVQPRQLVCVRDFI
jgi:hypothetical protein